MEMDKELSMYEAFMALSDISDEEFTLDKKDKALNEGGISVNLMGSQGSKEVAEAKAEVEASEKYIDDTLQVIDADADVLDHLGDKSDYIGDMLAMCPVCYAVHFIDVGDLIPSEEDPDIYNIEDECPNCHTDGKGFEIIGQVGKVKEEEAAAEGEQTEEVSAEENVEAAEEETPEEEVPEEELPTPEDTDAVVENEEAIPEEEAAIENDEIPEEEPEEEKEETKESLEEDVSSSPSLKDNILGWLSEHKIAFTDAVEYFGETPDENGDYKFENVSLEELVDWISDHEQLYSDFLDAFCQEFDNEYYRAITSNEDTDESFGVYNKLGDLKDYNDVDEDDTLTEDFIPEDNIYLDVLGILAAHDVDIEDEGTKSYARAAAEYIKMTNDDYYEDDETYSVEDWFKGTMENYPEDIEGLKKVEKVIEEEVKKSSICECISDLLGCMVNPGSIKKCSCYNEQPSLLYQGAYEELPQELLGNKLKGFDTLGGILIINVTPDKGDNFCLKDVLGLYDDEECDQISLFDSEEGDELFCGKKCDALDKYSDYGVDCIEAPSKIKFNTIGTTGVAQPVAAQEDADTVGNLIMDVIKANGLNENKVDEPQSVEYWVADAIQNGEDLDIIYDNFVASAGNPELVARFKNVTNFKDAADVAVEELNAKFGAQKVITESDNIDSEREKALKSLEKEENYSVTYGYLDKDGNFVALKKDVENKCPEESVDKDTEIRNEDDANVVCTVYKENDLERAPKDLEEELTAGSKDQLVNKIAAALDTGLAAQKLEVGIATADTDPGVITIACAQPDTIDKVKAAAAKIFSDMKVAVDKVENIEEDGIVGVAYSGIKLTLGVSNIPESFKTRKELTKRILECKNNNKPYRVTRSLKEGYRYDLIVESYEDNPDDEMIDRLFYKILREYSNNFFDLEYEDLGVEVEALDGPGPDADTVDGIIDKWTYDASDDFNEDIKHFLHKGEDWDYELSSEELERFDIESMGKFLDFLYDAHRDDACDQAEDNWDSDDVEWHDAEYYADIKADQDYDAWRDEHLDESLGKYKVMLAHGYRYFDDLKSAVDFCASQSARTHSMATLYTPDEKMTASFMDGRLLRECLESKGSEEDYDKFIKEISDIIEEPLEEAIDISRSDALKLFSKENNPEMSQEQLDKALTFATSDPLGCFRIADKVYHIVDDDLKESMTLDQFQELNKLAKEIGVETFSDMAGFLKSEAQPGETELDTFKRYRKELGPDFKIKESAMSEICEDNDDIDEPEEIDSIIIPEVQDDANVDDVPSIESIDGQVVSKIFRIAKDTAKAIKDTYGTELAVPAIVADILQDLQLITGEVKPSDLPDTPINDLNRAMYTSYEDFYKFVDELTSIFSGEHVHTMRSEKLRQAIQMLDSENFSKEGIAKSIASPKFAELMGATDNRFAELSNGRPLEVTSSEEVDEEMDCKFDAVTQALGEEAEGVISEEDEVNDDIHYTEPETEIGDWEKRDSKKVIDSDGFVTEYVWYYSPIKGKHIFMFGDSDIEEPDEQYADWEDESEENAQEWFDNYVGPGDDNDYDDNFDSDAFDQELNKYFDESYDASVLYTTTSGSKDKEGNITLSGIVESEGKKSKIKFLLQPSNELNESEGQGNNYTVYNNLSEEKFELKVD